MSKKGDKLKRLVERDEEIADLKIDELYILFENLNNNFRRLKEIDVEYRELELKEGPFGEKRDKSKTLKRAKEIIEETIELIVGEDKIEGKMKKIVKDLKKNLTETDDAIKKLRK